MAAYRSVTDAPGRQRIELDVERVELDRVVMDRRRGRAHGAKPGPGRAAASGRNGLPRTVRQIGDRRDSPRAVTWSSAGCSREPSATAPRGRAPGADRCRTLPTAKALRGRGRVSPCQRKRNVVPACATVFGREQLEIGKPPGSSRSAAAPEVRARSASSPHLVPERLVRRAPAGGACCACAVNAAVIATGTQHYPCKHSFLKSMNLSL
jgi:hypothetical protein